MRNIRITDEAVEEAIEAAAWYEQEWPGLGVEFSQALEAALDLLQAEVIPLANVPGVARSRAKRLLLKRFPYDVIVREFPTEVIVVAVAHQSRRPKYWRNRLLL